MAARQRFGSGAPGPTASSSPTRKARWRVAACLLALRPEEGALRAVAAHYWNGNLVLQAAEHLEPLLEGLAGRATRPVRELVGPWAQVARARRVLGLEEARSTLESKEVLFALALTRLRVPPALESGEVRSRRPREEEVDLLVRWRHDYLVEVMGKHPGEALIVRAHTRAGARGPHRVQRPPAGGRPGGGRLHASFLRGRGYARAAVAGSLRTVLAEGCQSAVLFTPVENLPAQRSYRAIGFEEVGDYGLFVLEQEHRLRVSTRRE